MNEQETFESRARGFYLQEVIDLALKIGGVIDETSIKKALQEITMADETDVKDFMME